MLSFTGTDEVTLAMWLQRHVETEPKRFKCCGEYHPYYVVNGTFNPDMHICFGYCGENKVFYISENVPANIRTLILQIEYRRINLADHKRHHHALRISLEAMPTSAIKALLVSTLVQFYKNLCLHYEHGEESLESRDAAEALRYLRSL